MLGPVGMEAVTFDEEHTMRPTAEWETCGRAKRRGQETRAERVATAGLWFNAWGTVGGDNLKDPSKAFQWESLVVDEKEVAGVFAANTWDTNPAPLVEDVSGYLLNDVLSAGTKGWTLKTGS